MNSRPNEILVMMTFTYNPDLQDFSEIQVEDSFIETPERLMQVTPNQNNEEWILPITAPGFAGFVISIALVLALYLVYTILDDIKVPLKFYDQKDKDNKEFSLGAER